MKKTGTQFLRNAASPDIRNQDGVKDYLFCNEYEQILGGSEKWF